MACAHLALHVAELQILSVTSPSASMTALGEDLPYALPGDGMIVHDGHPDHLQLPGLRPPCHSHRPAPAPEDFQSN
jgi:hypothetical protein